jgi:hypothetical protein
MKYPFFISVTVCLVSMGFGGFAVLAMRGHLGFTGSYENKSLIQKNGINLAHKWFVLSFSVKGYLRQTAPSFLIIFMMAYGMAVGNSMLSWAGFILVFGAQMGWQVYKSAKSRPLLETNVKEAARAKRSRALLYMSPEDVRSAQMAAGSSAQMTGAMKMIGPMLAPLAVFFGVNYLVGLLWPGTPQWQSYVSAALLSIPVSAVVMARSGTQLGGPPRVTPSAYLVSERGIIFDQMGRSLILRFPLKKAEKGREANCVEVDGLKENDLVPYRLKLCTDKVEELVKLLAPRVETY